MRGREKHAVLEMDMPVKILLEIGEPREERTVGVARIGRRIVTAGEFMQACKRRSCIIMLVEHARDRAIKAHRARLSAAHRRNRGKEDLFLLHHVAVEFGLQTAIDIKDLDK